MQGISIETELKTVYFFSRDTWGNIGCLPYGKTNFALLGTA